MRFAYGLVGLLSSLVIALACGWTLWLSFRQGPDRARIFLTGAILWAMNLLLAATLFRLILLDSWSDIGLFAIVFGLRLLVKAALVHEVGPGTKAATPL